MIKRLRVLEDKRPDQISPKTQKTFLSQRKYAVEILERDHMANCNSSRTPIDTESKQGDDVRHACHYMHDPREPHFLALNRILCTEAEYRGLANDVAETCWLQNLLLQHQQSKHIEIDIHFVRDLVATGQKYIVCNRKGCPKDVWLNTIDPKKNDRQVRSSNFRVCGCKARVVFDMVLDTTKYILTTFDDEHNHELDRVEYKHLSKAERKLTYNEQLFIIKAANANIVAVRAHNLYTYLKGLSSLVHGTQTEFKNFTCDVNCFIGDSDAQMLITRMEQRQEFTKDSFDNFFEDAELCSLFWADEVTKCNYKEFGDILFIIKVANANIGAVRAHNLYTGLKGSSSLVHGTQNEFKNFTCGVNCFIGDNDAHMLINRIEERQEFTKDFSFDYFIEDAELCGLFWADLVAKTTRSLVISYLLMRLIKQTNGVMRLAVAAEFPEFKHSLCMWHIMQKIPSKNVSRIYDVTNFKDKFGKIVWNMFIGPEEFEDKWNKLMEEFNLVNHKWLSKMYHLRSSGITAFFVDSPLCGLMRTTSRSESKNSFFLYFTSSGLTLVKFNLCYESAMERQRHTQEKLDHQSFELFLVLLTPLPIEEHVAKVYTRSLFIRVQKEIVAGSWLCSITSMSLDEGCTVCIIHEEKIKHVGLPEVIDKESTSENVEEEINLHQKVIGHYKVLYNKGDGSVSCCCQLFVRSGI
nr:hypothetical protein [Tanacetum cinerariifolium]